MSAVDSRLDLLRAPASKLLKTLISGKLRFTLPVGFGCWMYGTLRTVRYWLLSEDIPRYRRRSCPRDSNRHACCSTPSWALSRSSANSRDNQLL